MKKENIGFMILCICYLLYFITMGVYSPFLNVYYERIGLEGSQIGMINSAGYVAAMLFSPLWGAITDRTHRYKSMISFLLMATAFTGIIWQKQTVFIWIFVMSLFLNIFRSNIGNILDGLCIQFCNVNHKEFSMIRAMGSLGYLLGSFVIGNLLFELFQIQGPYMQVLLIACSIASFLLIFVEVPEVKQPKEKHDFRSNIKDLICNHDYLFILVLCFFTSMAMDSAVNYIGNHLVMTLHLEDSTIGLVTCAMVLPEILIVMKIHMLIQRYGLKKMFLAASILQMLRFFVYAGTSNLYIFMLISMVHGVMVGVGSVGTISYIHKKVPTYMLATAMTVYGGFTVIGYALQSQIYGTLYQLFGSHMIFMMTMLFTLIAFIMTLKTKRFD